ncbi:MAG: hypothetical protein JXP73_19420 [Deltaproteobacteria bacterium]|nr:hypothetical protein [Deltaproteobacteria bacterium]
MSGAGERADGRDRPPRPRWLTFLAVLLLLVGGRLFVTSASDLHRVATGTADVLDLDGSLDAQQETLLRGQVVLVNALSRHRPVSLAVHALARLGLGLLYLFAVAAIFSGDTRGGRAGLLAGWAGVVVSAGHALFLVAVVRPMLPWLAPMLGDALARDAVTAGRTGFDPHLVAAQASFYLLQVPLAVTGVAVAWSLVLVAYFRGRRVRLFYNGQLRQVDHD